MDHKSNVPMKERPREFRRRSDIERTSALDYSGETELRMAIEATGLGIFDYYPLSEELYWSHITKQHFGLSADAHVNYNVFLVGLHPEDRGRVDGLVRRALRREDSGRFSTEYRTIGIEDGRERWIQARGQAFFNDKGEAVRLIGTTLDITEHRLADEKLKQAVRDLESLKKQERAE